MALNPPIREWRGLRCWVVGAGSGIGEALARALGERGARVAVSSRREQPLRALAARIGVDRTLVLPLDVRDAAALAAGAGEIVRRWDGIDLVVFMAGAYRPMRAWDIDIDAARGMVETNVVGVLNGVAAVVPVMLRQQAGTMAIVSSVAGYRGLPKSLVYGPTKAALINLAEALYLDLRGKGIGVRVVNPGFVATPLTAGNDFRMPALIGADEAAEEIVAGLEGGGFEIHFPRRFTRVMKLLRLLPPAAYFPAIRRLLGQ